MSTWSINLGREFCTDFERGQIIPTQRGAQTRKCGCLRSRKTADARSRARRMNDEGIRGNSFSSPESFPAVIAREGRGGFDYANPDAALITGRRTKHGQISVNLSLPCPSSFFPRRSSETALVSRGAQPIAKVRVASARVWWVIRSRTVNVWACVNNSEVAPRLCLCVWGSLRISVGCATAAWPLLTRRAREI